ncbi:acetyl-CoA carboxylase biotin carboxyl carrier protein [Liquorilactobacillus hordei]|uniref:Biotin carboxyl carrier protein of acetyl-CoA carboxylase n=1 Tax=Liquorilactobacillus hordei DSM 19519 TaxID=1423759 RepID=A0A0R1MRD2_9LACO|nr:biotin/lipoyl-containing protein [Liquorilactobacillus hordei]KRL06971.1 acetyl-CoA carboxylase, biotin carboxyl carrier protein [Liquorilactobacillus hordei DSM 19519]QYH51668.1 acetyl-CoA carboxylase biotin carboxyl carrier protein subunit [Liquorilactobacillus hordei DSM 19519]
MEIPSLDELISKFQEAGLTYLEIKNGENQITLKKEIKIAAPITNEQESVTDKKTIPEKSKKITINAPFVGTFYTSPSPQEDTFVKIGDKIQKGQVIGIIEAMKMMTEVKSEVTGTITEILVTNESTVEYNTPLIVLKN